MSRLSGKVAIVTGAAEGIGLAISREFAAQQARVVMSDIQGEKCEAESAAINASGGDTIAIKCSVGQTGDVQAMVEKTLHQFSKIDVLVNNAGIARPANITQMEESDWDELMNVNLKGVFRGIKYVLPHMLKQGSGSVISISSLQASRSWDNWTAYAAAKGAIVSMTTNLAGQFGKHNIRFNTISPGAIATPLNKKRIAEEGEEFLSKSITQAALHRMGEPQEVANLAVFLASDESTFITGEDIRIDGGLGTLPRYL